MNKGLKHRRCKNDYTSYSHKRNTDLMNKGLKQWLE